MLLGAHLHFRHVVGERYGTTTRAARLRHTRWRQPSSRSPHFKYSSNSRTTNFGNPAWLFVNGYHKLFLRISHGASRLQEVLADRRDGTLLFGSARDEFASAASPVLIGAITATCTATNAGSACAPGASRVYSSVEIVADDTIAVSDSETASIHLGGVPYDVRVTAQAEHPVVPSPCADYFSPGGVALDIQATNLDELLSTLEVGPPPACRQGNDPDRTLYWGLYEVSLGTAYEGVVTYRGPDPNSPGGYLFDVPGLASQTDTPPSLSIQGASDLLPEPAVGREFWLSYPSYGAQALRESEGGPLLLASSYEAADELSSLLGVSVTHEGGCEYLPSVSLQETVFGTEPELRVESGTSGTLVLDGHPYRAWASSLTTHTVTVYPAD